MPIATNTLLPSSLITKAALKALKNNSVMLNWTARDVESLFKNKGFKTGDTIQVKLPARYTSGTGPAIVKNNSVTTSVPLTLIQKNVGMGFTSKDLTLSIADFASEILNPAVAQLANDFEAEAFKLYYQAGQLVTPGAYTSGRPAAYTGADVGTLQPFLWAGARLTEAAAPVDGKRYVAVSPACQANLVDGLKSLFQSTEEIAKQYEQGVMGLAAGFTFKVSQNVLPHTAGTRTNSAGAAVDGASQTGTSLLLKSVGASVTINRGDTFTITGVYAVNPLTRNTTGKLQVFSVQNTVTSSAGGAVTVSILPAISVSTNAETVNALAADSAAVTWTATSSTVSDANLAWHKDAIVHAFVDLEDNLPGAVVSVARDPDTGMAIRLTEQYNVETDESVKRLDILFGWAIVRPTHVVRIHG